MTSSQILERARTPSHHWNWAKLINRGNQLRGGQFTTFCSEASTGVPKGEAKVGD
ncbi:unnamed protein product [Tenebrio molitor]|nr:unnamed protein product [Tenebrio molitor]